VNPPDFDPATYGDRMAEVFDEWFVIPGEAEDAVSFLSELADRGRGLELSIETGRVALPLAERGTEVHGIDASEAMVEKLRAKPGGQSVPVNIGDFADVAVEGRPHNLLTADS
jgi:predicted TPR repeat methyltransferase